jgi:hypothetical protein
MRNLTAALIAVSFVMLCDLPASLSAERCGAIRDSAICLSTPNCHYDVNQRGCVDGPLPRQDACAVHGSEGICDSDVALGCKWNAARSACASKSE